jgi:hypothetical protein
MNMQPGITKRTEGLAVIAGLIDTGFLMEYDTAMKRAINKDLIEWKNSLRCKPPA